MAERALLLLVSVGSWSSSSTYNSISSVSGSNVGVPGGLVGGPRAHQNQFRGFKSHRVHARRVFSCMKKMISGKRESVS